MNESLKKENIPELTGLRGLAAFFIIINHVVLLLPHLRDTPLFHFTWLCGVAGMSLFFVLSGVVIYYNYYEKMLDSPANGIHQFLIARFARLYPLYFVFILGFFVWNAIYYPQLLPQNISSLPLFLAGLQSWIYGYIDGTEIIYLQGSANISWSISTEFALYFFFIPFVFIIGRFNLRKAAMILISAIVLQALFVYVVTYCGWATGWIESIFPGHVGASGVYLTYHSPYGRVFEFICGCAIAMLYIHRFSVGEKQWMKYVSSGAWLLSAICLGCAYLKVLPAWTPVLVSTGFIFFCAGLPYCGVRVLRWKPLIFMGDVSYSAYLLHIVFVIKFRYDGAGIPNMIYTVLAFISLTYVLAWISFKHFETPARRLVRSFYKVTAK